MHSTKENTGLSRNSKRGFYLSWIWKQVTVKYLRLNYFSKLSSSAILPSCFLEVFALFTKYLCLSAFWHMVGSHFLGSLRLDGAMWPVLANRLRVEVKHFTSGPRIQLLIRNPLKLSFPLVQQHPYTGCFIRLGFGVSMTPWSRTFCPLPTYHPNKPRLRRAWWWWWLVV